MITDDQLQLITAAIDGELSPDESRRLARLLESSPEAQVVYAKLKTDSVRLRVLPPVTPPVNLAKKILARVAATPAPPPVAAPADRRFASKRGATPWWVPVAVAASFLLFVGSGTFWFFSRQDTAANTGRPSRLGQQPRGSSHDALVNALPSDNEPRPSVPAPRERPEQHVAQGNPAKQPEVAPYPPLAPENLTAIAPDPRPYRDPRDVLGAPSAPSTHFDTVQTRLPLLRSLSEFDRADTRQELATELVRDPAFRLDLFTRDPVRGAEVFQAAAKNAGVTVFADATTLDRLKKRQVTSVVLYTESFTAIELAELFGKLCAEDTKISPRVFDMLHAVPVSSSDNVELRSVLGTDAGLFKRAIQDKPTPEKSEKADPSKPLSAGTADHIVKSVTGTPVKATEKTAVLLTWGPTAGRTVPTASSELKQFLAKRGERKANAVPAIIVIRPGNG